MLVGAYLVAATVVLGFALPLPIFGGLSLVESISLRHHRLQHLLASGIAALAMIPKTGPYYARDNSCGAMPSTFWNSAEFTALTRDSSLDAIISTTSTSKGSAHEEPNCDGYEWCIQWRNARGGCTANRASQDLRHHPCSRFWVGSSCPPLQPALTPTCEGRNTPT